MGRLIVLSAVCLGLLAALAGPAATDEDLRTITFRRETTEPGCIGNPVTPLCAVETDQACSNWSDRSLCRAVGYDPGALLAVDGYLRLTEYRYKPVGQFVLRDEDIPAWARNRRTKEWKAGDLALEARFQWCRPEDACVKASREDPKRKYGEGCLPDRCGTEDHPRTYILRQQGEFWHVIDIYIPHFAAGEVWKRK